MTHTRDNPPAFPLQTTVQVQDCDGNPHAATAQYHGMSLRDYFAVRASDADVSSYQNYQMDEFGEFVPRLSREEAKYAYADAMLAARVQS